MRCAVRLLALPATLAILGAGAADPLAHVAAVNGHAAAVHFRATSERVVDGRREHVTFEQFGARALTRSCVADACAGWWFDGKHLSTFGLNGVAMPQDDEELAPVERTLAAIVSYAFAEPDFRDAGGSVESAGPHRWRVRASAGETLIVQLEARTEALERVTQIDGRLVETYGSPVRAGGASFALQRAGLDDASLDRVDAVAGSLDAPDGAPVTFAGDASAALASDRVPIVDCTVAGRAARCLLDTGATPSAIALPLAEALGLEPRGELEIHGFSRFATGFVETGPLTIGAAHFATTRLAVIPTVAGAHFDVVVGADLLYRLDVVINRASNVARITRPDGVVQSADSPLTFFGGVPHIDTELAGERSNALLDSGDASIVSLGYAAYRRGPQWPVIERSLASGVGGASDAFAVTIPSLHFGAESFGPTRAEVGRTQNEVHIGIGLWTRCAVELNESRRRFGCVPKR